MLKQALGVVLCVLLAWGAVPDDKMTKIPGYPSLYNTSIYSGYLDVGNANRSIHYVFVEAVSGENNSAPVTLWLNGGPGCSSMLGFLQEIGPYFLETGKNWTDKDPLTENIYSWHKLSNLLFFESPAGVGYSYNLDPNWKYNDSNVAQDNLNALVDFFKKYKEYSRNTFWLAGESYAGKYIPDLAVLIDKYNRGNPIVTINVKGQLVGNGVMSFAGAETEVSETDFVINHEFVDPELIQYWRKSCRLDPVSAGCRYFRQRFIDNAQELNPYSIYQYCYYNDSFMDPNGQKRRAHSTQETILKDIMRLARPENLTLEEDMETEIKKIKNPIGYNDPTCAFFDGVHSYFNENDVAFHAKFKGQIWNGPCATDVASNYTIDVDGSMASYRYLLTKTAAQYRIVLYNGDWDAVVPYIDTIKNLRKLNLIENEDFKPWFTNGQHSGFFQTFSGVQFITVKGASHQVPQTKRAEAYKMFLNVLNDAPFN